MMNNIFSRTFEVETQSYSSGENLIRVINVERNEGIIPLVVYFEYNNNLLFIIRVNYFDGLCEDIAVFENIVMLTDFVEKLKNWKYSNIKSLEIILKNTDGCNINVPTMKIVVRYAEIEKLISEEI